MTEEKEAIEIIKSIININKENERTTAMLCVSDVDILLNLIEKLQKENEELRKNQKYKKDFNGEKIFCLEYDKETLRDIVLEQQEEIKELNNRDTSRLSEIGRLRTKNNHLENEIKYYYIPKDEIEKIKNKNIGQYMNFYREIEELLEEE